MDNKPKDSTEPSNTVQPNQQPQDGVASDNEPQTVDEALKDMEANKSTETAGAGHSAGSDLGGQVTAGASSPQADTEEESGSKKPLWISLASVFVLALFGLGGYMAYAQMYMPSQAPISYFEQLADFNSGEFEVTLDLPDDDLGNDFDISIKGEFINTDDEYAFDTETNLDLGAGAFGIDANLDLRYVDEVVYLRSNLVEFLTMGMPMGLDGPQVDPDGWYSIELDEDQQDELSEAFDVDLAQLDDACSEEDAVALEEYFRNDAADNIEIVDPKRHDWFGKDRDGQRVSHYSGTIEGTSFIAVAEGAVEVTSDDCISDDDIEEIDREEAESVSLEYDLYRGSDHDEMVVSFVEDGEKEFGFTLETGNYNGDIDIQAPEESQPLEDILGDLEELFAPAEPQPQPEPDFPHDDEFEELEEFDFEAEFDESDFQVQ